MLRDRENGRNDDRAGMHRPAFERVVVILAVRGGAVDERRVVGTEAAAWPIAVALPPRRGSARPRSGHVVGGCARPRTIRRRRASGDRNGLARASPARPSAVQSRRQIAQDPRQWSRGTVSFRAVRRARHSLTSEPVTMSDRENEERRSQIGSSRKIE